MASIQWPATLELSGRASGTIVELDWVARNYRQSYAEILRDGRNLGRANTFCARLTMPDYNVHQYTVRSTPTGAFSVAISKSLRIGPSSGVLPVPQPVYPLPGDLAPRTLTLRTDPVPGVSRYRFEVWNARTGALVKRVDTTATRLSLTLDRSAAYRWRVAALSMNGSSVAAVGRFCDQVPFTTGR